MKILNRIKAKVTGKKWEYSYPYRPAMQLQRGEKVVAMPFRGDDGGVHVRPIGDAIEHELSDDCPCEPRIEPVFDDENVVGFMTVHRALDEREW